MLMRCRARPKPPRWPLPEKGIAALSTASDWVIATYADNAPVGARRFRAFPAPTGIVVGGWLMAKSAGIAAAKLAEGSSDDFYRAKLVTAAFCRASSALRSGLRRRSDGRCRLDLRSARVPVLRSRPCVAIAMRWNTTS